jgi:DNA-directed RNA polymerase specialized sigma24 family protein
VSLSPETAPHELRYFGGLSVEETAKALGVSAQTALRDWKLARARLGVELSEVAGRQRMSNSQRL